jgi:hypothetical protein
LGAEALAAKSERPSPMGTTSSSVECRTISGPRYIPIFDRLSNTARVFLVMVRNQ